MDAINKAIQTKEAFQRKVLENLASSPLRYLEKYREAAEQLRAISSQKVDWDRIVDLAPTAALYEALEKTIDDAVCLTVDERAELRNSIADEMADLREWATNRVLRRPEQWFAGDTE